MDRTLRNYASNWTVQSFTNCNRRFWESQNGIGQHILFTHLNPIGYRTRPIARVRLIYMRLEIEIVDSWYGDSDVCYEIRARLIPEDVPE